MRTIKLVVFLLAVLALSLGVAVAQESNVDERYVGTVPAPEFATNLEWINVDAPLTIDGLRGKILIFDFWTYGCINCIHMIPILEQIEEKFADEVVVIGVHSAKFENEGETSNIRQIVQRYNLHHPVINDSDFLVWQSYGSRAWPTFAVVDPRGNVVAVQSGEIPFEAFDQYLSGMIAYYDGLGEDDIDRTPIELALEGAGDPGTPLLYPGKVLADAEDNRLFIADSNHHRIVIADLTTFEVLDVIGTGQRGFDNGSYEAATFNQPQGMTLNGTTLYVADTNNHAIRAIDLETKEVTTIAGTGTMGRGILQFGVELPNPQSIDIRSPWDVEMGDDGQLYIAMAGTHQLWTLDLNNNTIGPSVGNGREAQFNDTLATSELAQPSGLYYLDGLLYFADSESSTIRVADFNNDTVQVVSGTTENNLFDFGDIDGELGINRLQHALGVEGVPNGDIYIADTYNSRIKVVPAGSTDTATVYGLGGNGGYQDGDSTVAEFDEPGGLSYADGNLYIADTNNHVIRVIDLETETVSTIQFANPEVLALDTAEITILGSNSTDDSHILLDEQTVLMGEQEVVLHLELPDDFKINDLIDSTITLRSETEAVMVNQASESNELAVKIEEKEISIPVSFTPGEDGRLYADLTLYYCRTGEEALCFIDRRTFEMPVSIVSEGEAATALTINHTVTPPVEAEGDL